MTVPLQAHRIEATLTEDGTLTLEHLPFSAGATVEVIILPYAASASNADQYPLRGTPYFYHEPTEPAIAEEEWDALSRG